MPNSRILPTHVLHALIRTRSSFLLWPATWNERRRDERQRRPFQRLTPPPPSPPLPAAAAAAIPVLEADLDAVARNDDSSSSNASLFISSGLGDRCGGLRQGEERITNGDGRIDRLSDDGTSRGGGDDDDDDDPSAFSFNPNPTVRSNHSITLASPHSDFSTPPSRPPPSTPMTDLQARAFKNFIQINRDSLDLKSTWNRNVGSKIQTELSHVNAGRMNMLDNVASSVSRANVCTLSDNDNKNKDSSKDNITNHINKSGMLARPTSPALGLSNSRQPNSKQQQQQQQQEKSLTQRYVAVNRTANSDDNRGNTATELSLRRSIEGGRGGSRNDGGGGGTPKKIARPMTSSKKTSNPVGPPRSSRRVLDERVKTTRRKESESLLDPNPSPTVSSVAGSSRNGGSVGAMVESRIGDLKEEASDKRMAPNTQHSTGPAVELHQTRVSDAFASDLFASSNGSVTPHPSPPPPLHSLHSEGSSLHGSAPFPPFPFSSSPSSPSPLPFSRSPPPSSRSPLPSSRSPLPSSRSPPPPSSSPIAPLTSFPISFASVFSWTKEGEGEGGRGEKGEGEKGEGEEEEREEEEREEEEEEKEGEKALKKVMEEEANSRDCQACSDQMDKTQMHGYFSHMNHPNNHNYRNNRVVDSQPKKNPLTKAPQTKDNHPRQSVMMKPTAIMGRRDNGASWVRGNGGEGANKEGMTGLEAYVAERARERGNPPKMQTTTIESMMKVIRR